ncbi:hypothetical protein QZJ86_01100 [Methylomonas montana]|uniref:hypothetical protein n=1 Tax=Methylomonas montana TaxID=3058963 RepID=UPI00265ACCA8|nr:hypothetical protein [Methylomonas montana]WKJ90763.1 hypothetical protein QZJ86_01100 [Methylomonas montana]
MKDIANSFGVAACGLVTSVLTALAVVVMSRMTGFDFFTFSIWVVVPVGALLTGFAAASGYYFGSLYFHKRAGLSLLAQMIVIAGLTQLLIYYMGYSTLVLNDGRRVSDFIPFGQYLDISLTSAHYSIGRAMTDTGEVGSFGYWLAAFQFVGFLVGGLSVYGFLATKPVCEKCNLYLRPLSKREKTFSDGDSASPYYDALFEHPVDGPEFAALIRSEEKAKAEKGVVLVKTVLHGCPKCKSQLIEEKVQVHNGSEWKDADKLNRRVTIPDGVDLLSIFRP